MSQLLRDNNLKFVEDINLSNHSTKNFLNEIKFIQQEKKMLLILEKITVNIFLATRNIKNILVIEYKNINPFLLLKFDKILITQSAIKYIEERFK